MQFLLGFAPFIVFAALTRVSVSLALWLALAAGFALGIRNFLHKRELRLLDCGSIVLFGGLALLAGFILPGISIGAVRLTVNGGLTILAFASIIFRRPLTLPYAREQVAAALWSTPHFLTLNYRISTAWMAAFAAMAVADVLTLLSYLPLSGDIAIGLVALVLAIVFTLRAAAASPSHSPADAAQ